MPMRVWDNQEQKARTVSEAEAQKGIAEGRFQLRSGVELPVRSPEGEAYTISSDEAATAFSKGWSLETPEQVREVFDTAAEKSRKAVAEDMEGTAFLQGALKTATFGLSDAGIQAFTDIEPEMQTAVQEENPIASTLGEVAGALPLAGPAAAAARGTAALGKMAGTSKVAQKAAEFAADGLAYGMGESISDLALGRPEEVAGNLIMGGALGGVLGGTVGALSPVAKAAKDAIFTGAEKMVTVPTTKLATAVAKRKARSMGVEGAEELIESGRFRDVLNPEKVNSFEKMAKDAGVNVAQYQQQAKTLSTDLKKFKREYAQSLKSLNQEALGQQKEALNGVLAKLSDEQAMSAKNAASTLGEAINDIETIATNKFAEVKNKVATDGTLLEVPQVNNIKNTVEDLKLALEQTPTGTLQTQMQELVSRLDAKLQLPALKVSDIIPDAWDAKQFLTRNVNWAREKPTDLEKILMNSASGLDDAIRSTKMVSSDEIDLVNKLYTQRSALHKMTRNMRSPGVVDADSTRLKNLLDEDKLAARIMRDPEGKAELGLVFNKMTDFFETLNVDQNYLQKIKAQMAKAGEGKVKIDKQKLFNKESIEALKSRLTDDLSSFKTSSVDEIADMIMDMSSSNIVMRDKADAFLRLRKAQEYIASNPNLTTAEKYAHYAVTMGDKKGAERIQKLLEFQKDQSVMDKLGGQKPSWIGSMGILGSTVAGGADAGIMALAVTKAAHLANSPKAALQVIPTVEKFAQGGRTVLDKFTTGLSKALTSKTMARGVYAPAGRSEFEKRRKAIETNRDPSAFQERLTEAFEPLSAAPHIQNQLMMKAVQTQQFLDEKLPKDPLAGQGVWTPEYKPSETEVDVWNRRFEIAENPAAILPKIADGTVIPEEVETFKTLHPALFEETKRRMITELAQMKEPPPYNKLVTLSFVFETPTTPTLNGSYIMFMQELIANYPKDKVQSNKSLSKLDPMTFLSDGQQVTMR